MASSFEKTPVVIIGAGVAGLTLAAFLKRSDIACINLERRSREYIQARQRAGVVEARGVKMFERWGLADQLLAGPVAQTIDYRVDGESHVFEITAEDGTQGRFCTQQMLVNNLLRELIDTMRGDIRFEVRDVTVENDEGSPPSVSYTDASGRHDIGCEYIVGCDADRGISRSSIPPNELTTYTHEFGYAWLAALVEAPLSGHPIMGVSQHGFVAQLPRGPKRSRYYLQCKLSDSAADWPEERLWQEIRLRLGDETISRAPLTDIFFVPMRSVVHAPMQYRNLFLAGDAAHLVPPTGGKGMNMALYDVDVLASALTAALHEQNTALLSSYSETCLAHVWKYQEFSAWMTDTMHDAGDPALHGTFRQTIARTQIATLFDSSLASRLHSEYQRGFV